MKMLMRIVVVVLVLLAILFFTRNAIIEKMVRETVLKTTGFDVEMGSVRAGLIKPVFEIVDARLINPEDFAEPTALEIRAIKVGYDLPSLFRDEVHLLDVVVDVSRAVLVIREDGDTNLGRLGRVALPHVGAKTDAPAPGEEEPKEDKEEKPGRSLRVDSLTLRLDKVEVHQYLKGREKPDIDIYDVHFDRTARDVTDLDVINGMITAGVIEAVGVRALKNLTQAFRQIEGDPEQKVKQLDHTAKDVGKQLNELLKDTGVDPD